MKTKEFIKRVEELGYDAKKANNTTHILIHVDWFKTPIYVGTKQKNKINTDNLIVPDELFDLVVEYARTPIDEREEQTKYYWKVKGLGNKAEHTFYFKYNPYDALWLLGGNKIELDIYKTQFTEKRFKELKEYLGIELEFEKEEIGEE